MKFPIEMLKQSIRFEAWHKQAQNFIKPTTILLDEKGYVRAVQDKNHRVISAKDVELWIKEE